VIGIAEIPCLRRLHAQWPGRQKQNQRQSVPSTHLNSLQKASRICVDVAPAKTLVDASKKRHGADNLNETLVGLEWHQGCYWPAMIEKVSSISGKRARL